MQALARLFLWAFFVAAQVFTSLACDDKSAHAIPDAGVDVPDSETDADGETDAGAPCGNGLLDQDERCDIAILPGLPGACPDLCGDDDPCTTHFLTGVGCLSHCLVSEITNFIAHDDCCPIGGNLTNDLDCAASCGNGIVEPGEECDPPGSCPSACDDGDSCTADYMTGHADDCTARCSSLPVLACTHDDGCCPFSCNAVTDNDCAATCGNAVIEPGETCDPPASCPASCSDGIACTADVLTGSAGNCDVTCTYPAIVTCTGGDGCCPSGCNANNDSNCSPVCGNNVVEAGETCDPPASCPALPSCDDSNPCTTDLLIGSAATCTAACGTTPVISCLNGDGCCPSGCNMLTDDSCSANCGNGVIEPGETCDPPGTCPTACFDGNPCTTDTLTGSALNCNSACTYPAILSCVGGDGCCPSGCNANNDNNCLPACGNSVVEVGETCDPPASCPSSCFDGNACTSDVLGGAAVTCDVSCAYPVITTCTHDDGCCVAGCNALQDNNCPAVCGNSVTEPGETCDDGNLVPADGCDETCHLEGLPVVYRVNWIALRDPHLYIRPLFTCYDCTDNAVLGTPSVNAQMNTNISTDEDGDGQLDLSLVLLFRPLDQTAGYTGPAEAGEAVCSPPMASTVCDVDPGNPLRITTISNLGGGTCLEPYASTVRPFTPAIANTYAPPVCFTTDLTDIVLIISGTPVVLRNSQFAANYDGDPATGLISGLIRGFMTETQAQSTNVDLGVLGSRPLSDLLQPDACGTGDDRDYDLDGTTRGWWFYLNFTAARVTWVGP
ncbi:hypothetical protein KJ975_10720 [Myxococcota bacterium]|nr:hypothetical protein [Myxococcota bacterium]